MTKRILSKFVIIEPSPLVQEGLKSILHTNSSWDVVKVFSDLSEFEKYAFNFQINLIFINPALLDFNKRLALHQALPVSTEVPCIAIVNQYIESSVLQQFDNCIELMDKEEDIFQKVQNVLMQQPEHKVTEDHGLSDREKEILVAVAKGLSNKEIAEKHYISVNTVITHRKNITRKTNIKTVAGLTMYAMLNRLIQM